MHPEPIAGIRRPRLRSGIRIQTDPPLENTRETRPHPRAEKRTDPRTRIRWTDATVNRFGGGPRPADPSRSHAVRDPYAVQHLCCVGYIPITCIHSSDSRTSNPRLLTKPERLATSRADSLRPGVYTPEYHRRIRGSESVDPRKATIRRRFAATNPFAPISESLRGFGLATHNPLQPLERADVQIPLRECDLDVLFPARLGDPHVQVVPHRDEVLDMRDVDPRSKFSVLSPNPLKYAYGAGSSSTIGACLATFTSTRSTLRTSAP